MLLRARGLTKRFGDFTAVDGIDVEVHRGEAFGFLGPNGAGKSSTMKMVGCVSPVTAGELRILGMDPDADGPAIRARLGVCPQQDMLDEDLSVEENLIATHRGGRGANWSLEAVYRLFPRLKERRRNGGDQLSGGEQQMLAIGRALLTNPRLLILDEATEGLAPIIREEIWKTIGVIRSTGIATLIVDKTVAAVTSIADRVVILVKGEVVFEDTPAVLLANPDLMHRHLGV